MAMLDQVDIGEVRGRAVLRLKTGTLIHADGKVSIEEYSPISAGKGYDIYCVLYQVFGIRHDMDIFQSYAKQGLATVRDQLTTEDFRCEYQLRVYFLPTLYLSKRYRRLLDAEILQQMGTILGLYYQQAERFLECWEDMSSALNYLSGLHSPAFTVVLNIAAQLELPASLLRLCSSIQTRVLSVALLPLRKYFSPEQTVTMCAELMRMNSPESLLVADGFAYEDALPTLVSLALALPFPKREKLQQKLLHTHPHLLLDQPLQPLLDSPLRRDAGPLFLAQLAETQSLPQVSRKDLAFLATAKTIRLVIQAKAWQQLQSIIDAKGAKCLDRHVQRLLEAPAPQSILTQIRCHCELLRLATRIYRAKASVLLRAQVLQQCTLKSFVRIDVRQMLVHLNAQAARLAGLWLRSRTSVGRLPISLVRLYFEYI